MRYGELAKWIKKPHEVQSFGRPSCLGAFGIGPSRRPACVFYSDEEHSRHA